jgi:hypothetical protein
MRFQFYKVLFLFLLFYCWPLLSLAKDITDQNPLKGFYDFYGTPPGTVAFMLGVSEEEDPKSKALEFYELESDSYRFPRQTSYCFILNHRNLRSEEKTYISVEIISVMEQKQYLPVRLFRNEGWERERLNPSYRFRGDAPVEADPYITLDEFFIAHRIKIPPSAIDDIDENLDHAWHGTIKETSVSSWKKSLIWDKKDLISSEEFFEKFKPPIKAQIDNLRVDAFLIRFSSTEKEESTKHVYFCTTCKGKEAIYLYLDGPELPESSEFYITFDK